MRTLLLGIAALSLAACNTIPLSPSQRLEQADTAASLAYATVATAVNACEAINVSCAAKGETLKINAWALLMQERQLYAAGKDVTAVLGQLQGLETQAKALTP